MAVPAPKLVVDIQLIKQLLDQLCWSARRLGTEAGLSEGYVGLLLNGKRDRARVNLHTISKFAAALRVPWQSLVCESGLDPDRSPNAFRAQRWSKSDRLEHFYDYLERAHDHLVLTERIDGYLFPNEAMWKWAWTKYKSVPYFNESEASAFWRWSERVVDRQRKVRRDHNYVHKVISPASFFQKAAEYEPKYIEESLAHFAQLNSSTSVNILPPAYDWGTFRRRVADALLPTVGLPIYQWDQISVVNEYLAVIRVDSANYMYCYDPKVVRQIRQTIETITTDFRSGPQASMRSTEVYLKGLLDPPA